MSESIRVFKVNTDNGVEALKTALEEADAVIIGAGAGLSTSAGFVYNGERFEQFFSRWKQKYGFNDMYTGGFYPFETPEEMWAYWSKFIYVNRYMDPPKQTYNKLFELVKNKDYFVITTNVDHCFQKAGFDKERLFYTQGDYGLFQCSKSCHNKTYDNEEQIDAMITEQQDFKIPTKLIPVCPVCGRPMSMNLRSDDTFVEDEGWHKAHDRYIAFLESHEDQKVLFLELGVGANTPVIIKYPFWRMSMQWDQATYACINYSEAIVPEVLLDRSICLNRDIDEVLTELTK